MQPADPAAFLAKLYTIFASYPFVPVSTVLAKPIRRISSGELSRYAFKALTTWGDETDLRHFLPRLCELLYAKPTKYGPLFALSVYNRLFCDEAMSERLTAFFFRTTDPWLQTFISDGIAGLEERLA